MSELEMKQQVKAIFSQTINTLLNQGASFTMIEDALYPVLLQVKDGSTRELIDSLNKPEEEPSQEE